MFSKRKILPGILLFVGAILVISIFYNAGQGNKKHELLIVWGKHNEECFLWVIDPTKSEDYSTTPGESSCNYQIVTIAGKPSLAHIQDYPAKINIYDVQKDGEIISRQEISLPEIEITSQPQWVPGDQLYFSAIQNEHEAIFRFDNQSGTLEEVIQHPQAIASEPIASPDGRYLAYWVREGLSNRHECLMSDCFRGHYYLADLEENTQIDILSLLENPLPLEHCKLTWSPTGRFLAFQLGCDNFPNQIAILDMESKRAASTINPAHSTRYVDLNGWLSNTELVYEGGVFFDQYEETFPRNQVFSVETYTSRELANFTVFVNEGEPFRLFNINWTPDAKYIAGEGYGTFDEASTIIADSNGEFLQITYPRFHASYPISSTLSPYGNWVAFFSGNQTDGYTPILNIVDIEGVPTHKLELFETVTPQMAWLFP